MDIKEMST